MDNKVYKLLRHGYSSQRFVKELNNMIKEDPEFSSYLLRYLTKQSPKSYRTYYHEICYHRPDIIDDRFVLEFIKLFENSKKLSNLRYVSQILHLILKKVKPDQLKETTMQELRDRLDTVDLFIELQK